MRMLKMPAAYARLFRYFDGAATFDDASRHQLPAMMREPSASAYLFRYRHMLLSRAAGYCFYLPALEGYFSCAP